MNNSLGSEAAKGMSFDPCVLVNSFTAEWGAYDAENQRRPFKRPAFAIRAADSSGERSSASILIGKMYATRGYSTTPLPDDPGPNLITLVASDHHRTIGTLTVGFDSSEGLLADDLFGDEVDQRRAAGRKVCEFTKLAIDFGQESKPVLAALFNVAYLYAHKIRGVDDLLIEVNPRHARYYAGMLGFRIVGPKRMNRRVNAPAVLLLVEFDHVREKIKQFGGHADLGVTERSLYPYSFSEREESGIVNRLRRRFSEGAWEQSVTADARSLPEAAAWIPARDSPAIDFG